ncbi:MAG: hypothetical protein JW806_10225 [Sedimentisphaerales bacterium]|nr:hypothetical protein [Sedimentisphaerales bacterium]
MEEIAPVKIGPKGIAFLLIVGLGAWWIPGTGHWLIGQPKKAAIIFLSILSAFTLGIWLGSIAVIDAGTPWYWAQMLNSPLVAYFAHLSSSLNLESYGKPREIGEIYTAIAGMLNLLCVVNAVYLAHNLNIKKAD